jgi:lysozyme
MIDMNEKIQRLVMHEGCRLKPYYCTKGKQTIGVGRNLDDNPLTEEEKRVCGDWEKGITKNAAFYLLRHDIERVEKECKKKIAFYELLDDERQYALLDMSFNLGIAGLLKFKKMLMAMACGYFEDAAKECLDSKYAKEVGQRAVRIANTIRTGRFEV